MGGQHVELFFYRKSNHKWYYVTSGKTDSRGRATLRAKAYWDGWWIVQYWGDRTHFDSGGTSDYVDVR